MDFMKYFCSIYDSDDLCVSLRWLERDNFHVIFITSVELQLRNESKGKEHGFISTSKSDLAELSCLDREGGRGIQT